MFAFSSLSYRLNSEVREKILTNAGFILAGLHRKEVEQFGWLAWRRPGNDAGLPACDQKREVAWGSTSKPNPQTKAEETLIDTLAASVLHGAYDAETTG